MRYRLVDFLPLLLALALIGAWFWFKQPLPQLPFAGRDPAALAQQTLPVATAASVPSPVLSRAQALLSLCNAARPTFLGTLGSLKLRLGARMGDPADCERPVDEDGNTQQVTTTGLAYYRRHLNVAAFTDGWEHWALVETQILYWTGQAVDPPANATVQP
jgi:hypothetical protein